MAKSDPQVVQRLRDAQDDLWKVDPQNASLYEDALQVFDDQEAAREIEQRFLLPAEAPVGKSVQEDDAALALMQLGNSNHANAYVHDGAVIDTFTLRPFNPKSVAETNLPRLNELDEVAQETEDASTTDAHLATQRDIEVTTAENNSNTVLTTEATNHNILTPEVTNDFAPRATPDNDAALALLSLAYSGRPQDYVEGGISNGTPALRHFHSASSTTTDHSARSPTSKTPKPTSPRTTRSKGKSRIANPCAPERLEAPNYSHKTPKTVTKSVTQSFRKPRIRVVVPAAASSPALKIGAEQATKSGKAPAFHDQKSIELPTISQTSRKLRSSYHSPEKSKGKAPAPVSPGSASSNIRPPAPLPMPLETGSHKRRLRSAASGTDNDVGPVEAQALPSNRVTALRRSMRKTDIDHEGDMISPAPKRTREAQETLENSSTPTPVRRRLLRYEDSDSGEDTQPTPSNKISKKPKTKKTGTKAQPQLNATPAGLPLTAPPNTTGIPSDALALNEHFQKDHPCTLGVQLPVDRARTRWDWTDYVTRKTGNAQFDWSNEQHVRDVNRWRQQRIRRRLTEHGIVRDGRKHND